VLAARAVGAALLKPQDGGRASIELSWEASTRLRSCGLWAVGLLFDRGARAQELHHELQAIHLGLRLEVVELGRLLLVEEPPYSSLSRMPSR
jgi:hypothetical protein